MAWGGEGGVAGGACPHLLLVRFPPLEHRTLASDEAGRVGGRGFEGLGQHLERGWGGPNA